MNNNFFRMTLPFASACIQAFFQTLCPAPKKSASQAHRSIPKIYESRRRRKKQSLGPMPISLYVLMPVSWTQTSSLVSSLKTKEKRFIRSQRRDQETCKDICSRREEHECGIRERRNCSFYRVQKSLDLTFQDSGCLFLKLMNM